MTRKEIVKYLDEHNITPSISRGKIIALQTEDDDGRLTNVGSEVYQTLGIDPTDIGFLKEHPEGSDRGGYVPAIIVGDSFIYYDEMGDGWWR